MSADPKPVLTGRIVRWTVEEFAAHIGRHPITVYRMIWTGRLRPPYRARRDPGGRGWWILAEEISVSDFKRLCADGNDGI